MSVDHSEFTIVKLLDKATPRFDEGHEESITFVYGKMETIDNLGVDPNNPNTPGPDDNAGLPAVQKTDNGLLLPAVTDGTSNTFMFGEVVQPSPAGRTDGVFTVVLPSVPAGDEGHTGGMNAVFCDGSVRPLNEADYNPFVTVDYLV
jgi:prepilin-type processing-associated H-X9-DG protein